MNGTHRKPAALPDPVELGFPPKFTAWYPDQIRAIDLAVFNQKRFTALAMPTGSGKSVTGVATALLHPGVTRALYLTSSKGLQDQLATDFRDLGFFDVRGQRNYPCLALEEGGEFGRYRRGSRVHFCDEGPCRGGARCSLAPDRNNPRQRPDCTYYGAVFDARLAPLVGTNYAMWFASTEYAEGLGSFDLLILDEAHDADKELEAFLTLEIGLDDVKTIGSKFIDSDNVEDWRDWALFNKGKLRSRIELREQAHADTVEAVRELRNWKRIFGLLERFAAIDPLDWILERDPLHAKCAPLRVSKYAERYLFQQIPHVLLMSATLTHKTLADLGVQRDVYTYWECPSRFPLERRPIYSVNTHPPVRVDSRMRDDDKVMWLRRIDRLIEPRRALGRRGLIHTVSYQRVKELMAFSEHKDLFLVHDSANTRETVQQFRESKQPHILVSPSIITGYDFPDDFARYQIIGKVPLPDMRSPIMKIRGEHDKEYGGYLAVVKLIQACGRINRNPLDWGETFIVDDHFADWFLKRYRKHMVRSFLDALIFVESFPEPLDPSTF